MKKRIGILTPLLLLAAACSTPPKPQIPALTPEGANQILHYSTKAENWLVHARKQDPSCAYVLDFPDQTNHPTQLDFTHIMKCGGRPAPMEFDATVSFEFDKNAQRWVILRFSS